ncbi:hypothetical protein MMPV_005813 [Pyropia vietnamensis]
MAAPTGDPDATAIGAASRRTPGGRLVDALRRLGRPWAAAPSGDGVRRGSDGAGTYGDGLEAFRSVLPAVARDEGILDTRGNGDSRIDRRRMQSLPPTPWTVLTSGGGGDGVSRTSVARRSLATASSGHHDPSGDSTGSSSAERVAVTSPPPSLVTATPPVATLANWALPASLLITSPTANVGLLPPPPLTAVEGGGRRTTTGWRKHTTPGGATAAGKEASMAAATRGDAEVEAPAVAETEKATPAIGAPPVATPAAKADSIAPTGVGAENKDLVVEATAAGGEMQPVQATAAAGAPVAEPAVTTASPPATAEPPPMASPNKALRKSLLMTSPTANVETISPWPLKVVRGRGGGWTVTGATTLHALSEAEAATATTTRPTEVRAGMEAPVAATIWRDAQGVVGVRAVMPSHRAGFTAAPPPGPPQMVVAAPYESLVPLTAAANPPAAARAPAMVTLEPPPTVLAPLTPLSPTPRLPTPVPLPPPMFVRVGSAPPTAATAATAAALTAAAAAAVTGENPPDGGPTVLASAPFTIPTAAADKAAAKNAPSSISKPLMSLSTAAAAAPAMVVVAQAPPLPLQPLPEAVAVVGAVGNGVPPQATTPPPALTAPIGQPTFATKTATPAVGLTASPTAVLPPQTELPLAVSAVKVATGERGRAPPSPAVDNNPAAVMASVSAAMKEALAMPAAAVPASAADAVAADVTTRPRAAAYPAGTQARRGFFHRVSQRLAAAVAALSTDHGARAVAAETTAVSGGAGVVTATTT